MTVRELTQDEQIAKLVLLRDYLAAEAAYYRRRAETGHDRTLAIRLEEEWLPTLELVIANRRVARRADPVP